MEEKNNIGTITDARDYINLIDVLKFDGIKTKLDTTDECEPGYYAEFLDTNDDTYNIQLVLTGSQLQLDFGEFSLDVHTDYNTLLMMLEELEHTMSIDTWLIQNRVMTMMELGVKKFFNAYPEYNDMFGIKEELEDNMKGND